MPPSAMVASCFAATGSIRPRVCSPLLATSNMPAPLSASRADQTVEAQMVRQIVKAAIRRVFMILVIIPETSFTPHASLQFDLRIKRRGNVQPRRARSLEVRVEKSTHTVRRHSKLAASVDTDNAKHAQCAHHDMTFQQSSVVAEEKMGRATDRDTLPPIGRQAIVNRLDLAQDRTADRVGRIAMVAHEKHKRLVEAFLHDVAEGLSVDVDAGFAAGVVMAKLCGLRAAEGVAEGSHPRHVEPSGEL